MTDETLAPEAPQTPETPVASESAPITVDYQMPNGEMAKVPVGLAAHLQALEILASRQPSPASAPPSREPDAQVVSEDDKFDELWFTNPRQAARNIEERITRNLTERYQQERSQEQFWDTFARRHPDLSSPLRKQFADVVLRSNYAVLSALPLNDGIDRLAGLVRKELIAKDANPTQDNPIPPALAEGSTTVSQRPTEVKREPANQGKTLSDAIRERRAARRAANTKSQRAT